MTVGDVWAHKYKLQTKLDNKNIIRQMYTVILVEVGAGPLL